MLFYDETQQDKPMLDPGIAGYFLVCIMFRQVINNIT